MPSRTAAKQQPHAANPISRLCQRRWRSSRTRITLYAQRENPRPRTESISKRSSLNTSAVSQLLTAPPLRSVEGPKVFDGANPDDKADVDTTANPE